MARRDLGIDAARGVAVLSMLVAHLAPSRGPAGLLDLSEFLTAPLFALLIGMGAGLGVSRPDRGRAAGLRGAVLVLIGLLLMMLPSQIVIVLVWLGALTLIIWLLAKLPSPVLVGLMLGLVVVEPLFAGTGVVSTDPSRIRMAEFWATGPYYRMTAMTLWGIGGVLLVRADRSGDRARWIAPLALLGAAGLFVADKVLAVPLVPYSGSRQEIVFNLLLAVAATEGIRCVSRLLAAHRLRAAVSPLAAAGRMALTLYVIQILVTVGYLQTDPASGTDNSWALLVALALGSVGFAVAWQRALPSGPWSRGPVEGLVEEMLRVLPQRADRRRLRVS